MDNDILSDIHESGGDFSIHANAKLTYVDGEGLLEKNEDKLDIPIVVSPRGVNGMLVILFFQGGI